MGLKMHENLKISKKEFILAEAIKHTVGTAYEALTTVNTTSLSLSAIEAKTITDAAKILGKINDEAQAVIDQANKQYQDRDVTLINRAANRFFAIDSDIDLAKATQRGIQQAHDVKMDELKKQGFNQEEINNLLDDPAPVIEEFQQTIDALIKEKAKIEQFLGDAPRYDPNLLNGTTIEVGNSETAQAA